MKGNLLDIISITFMLQTTAELIHERAERFAQSTVFYTTKLGHETSEKRVIQSVGLLSGDCPTASNAELERNKGTTIEASSHHPMRHIAGPMI